MKARFKLTDSENNLVQLMLGGLSLKMAATHLDVTYETARSTLKKVFQKTGTHRQSELVLLALNIRVSE